MRPPSRHPSPTLGFVATIVCSSVLLLSSASANLVTNGGFEDGLFQLSDGGGVAAGGGSAALLTGSLAGWDRGPDNDANLNALATNDAAYFDINTGGPNTGSLAAVFPNRISSEGLGYISQAVLGTVAGTTYKISFYLANQKAPDNLDNYMDVRWGGTYTAGQPISGGVSLTGGTPPIPGAIPVPTNWTYYEFYAVAQENDTRLSFIGGNDPAGNLIDDVVVVVPEVSSFGVAMGLGLLALGTTMRLRRRTVALVTT